MNEVVELIDELHTKERDYLNNYLANAPKWLLEAFQIVRIKKGNAFIHENAYVDTVYILVEGVVKATDYRVQEIAYDYARFYPVEVFGAMEFLMGYEEYKTTLITETDCRFLRVSKDQFAKWMLTDIHAVLEQVKAMSVYLLEQVRKERLFLFLQGADRLFLLFMQIYQKSARHKVCRIRLTRKDLSNSTGLCIKTINRCVKKMEEDGYISREGRTIVIDRDQYQRIKAVVSEKIDEVEV
ncbi:Crp/Fnr family transcriptional regulator [Clostridium sp. AF19-22AC]|jgi:CRP/FNR family cyclic AMP-dependent transcriptional regulator|uniref:CRP/FNR family cyclic AMP-dependent transcriptional regulator n=1 Tax=Faecalicatena orotica TaxID=1544 RepID=A0A2Y9BIL1_9FIRM|nr:MULTISPECIES: Crp/Fnr family transcriptional regulator [Clostridia]PWJ29035.1 CRP/FNR family cyclic AMP-dependent transcriptional regulator [Faecalicatena orotica]RHR33201.1 Crp/Fnr family transcriptional regulator [Clostridium sp. AF19-22AC]SSA56205.1 CRP/FNR family transcriptional regulator, cyclic AMP receptor protein [Faecalicatena orotica]